jgi:hypothetical protein
MLTWEAMEERRWGGLSHLRSLLGPELREFEDRLHVTSVTESEFDAFGRSALLAALVAEKMDVLVAAVRSGADPPALAEGAAHDLHILRAKLGYLESRAAEWGRSIDAVFPDLYGVAADAARRRDQT